MSKIITPTVGRKVWFRLNGINELEKPRSGTETTRVRSFPSEVDPTQPLDATVVYVWNDRMVNLHVLDHYGNPFIAINVPLMQEGDTPPQFGFYAEWMPYQLGQAKKETADQQIEQEIQANGANVAPRITPADIESNITGEFFFTAEHGVEGAMSRGELHARDADCAVGTSSLRLLTFCVLRLRNGFTVTGESACASPENFNAEIGRQIARDNAVAKIWPLMGYELRSYLHAMKGPRTSCSTESLLEAINAEAGKVELIPIQAIGLQPIDTAPTDGAVFLGYRERDGRWGECYRVQRDDCEMWSFGGSSAAAEEFPNFKPTHWMPLPANSPA